MPPHAHALTLCKKRQFATGSSIQPAPLIRSDPRSHIPACPLGPLQALSFDPGSILEALEPLLCQQLALLAFPLAPSLIKSLPHQMCDRSLILRNGKQIC